MPYNYYIPDNFATVCVQADDGNGLRRYGVVVFEPGKRRGKFYDKMRFKSAEDAQKHLDWSAARMGWQTCLE